MSREFENAYVLNVVSDDHPGIIAAVSEAISRLKGNIDACSETVLGGYFTLIMIVSFAEKLDAADLAAQVHRAHPSGSDLQVAARPFVPTEYQAEKRDAETFVVTVFGADRPGVVLRFTQYLAGKDINIVDLYGQRTEDQFVLVSQVEIPAGWDVSLLQADLEEMGRELGFTVRLQHENIFVATNQLRLARAASGTDRSGMTNR